MYIYICIYIYIYIYLYISISIYIYIYIYTKIHDLTIARMYIFLCSGKLESSKIGIASQLYNYWTETKNTFQKIRRSFL